MPVGILDLDRLGPTDRAPNQAPKVEHKLLSSMHCKLILAEKTADSAHAKDDKGSSE